MLKEIIIAFFNELEIYEDINNNKNYKKNILNSILAFLDNNNDENAMNVYNTFFEAYWIGIQEDNNPFLEMIKKMQTYEKTGGQISTKQRDHFIHSVNVCILGVCIYKENTFMKDRFNNYIINSHYKNFYSTKHEEFFYRWGIASLSHDIAYPIEVLLEQLKEYSKFLNSYSIINDNLELSVQFKGTDKFNTLPLLTVKSEYYEEFKNKNPNLDLQDYTSSINIFANIISNRFNIDCKIVKTELIKKIEIMQSGAYIDHGFYSGIIILKWYHNLINKTQWDPSYFTYPICDIATSVLLHNFYAHGLMESPFNLKLLRFDSFPLAYLLILCDEIQEWDRICFSKGIVDTTATIKIESNEINLQYYSENEKLLNKKDKINSILDLKDILQININIKKEVKI